MSCTLSKYKHTYTHNIEKREEHNFNIIDNNKKQQQKSATDNLHIELIARK